MRKHTPVIYELDDDGEANGIIHWFCSPQCRDAAEDECRRVGDIDFGEDSDWSDGTICETCLKRLDEDELPEEYAVNMTSIERESLCNLVVAADVCCPEQVTDAVLETCEQEGYASALKAIAKFKANDPAERRALGIE